MGLVTAPLEGQTSAEATSDTAQKAVLGDTSAQSPHDPLVSASQSTTTPIDAHDSAPSLLRQSASAAPSSDFTAPSWVPLKFPDSASHAPSLKPGAPSLGLSSTPEAGPATGETEGGSKLKPVRRSVSELPAVGQAMPIKATGPDEARPNSARSTAAADGSGSSPQHQQTDGNTIGVATRFSMWILDLASEAHCSHHGDVTHSICKQSFAHSKPDLLQICIIATC